MDAEGVDCSSHKIQLLEIGTEYQHKTVYIGPFIRKETRIPFPMEKKQQC